MVVAFSAMASLRDRERGVRVLVIGAGAIGGVVGAHLSAAGADVTMLTTNPKIARALRERGFRVRGASELDAPAGPVLERLIPETPPFELMLLATQPPQVEAAAEEALPWLAPTGRLLAFQNGLCEERLAKLVGRERVLGGVVAWGASMLEPGVYDRTSRGGFTLGTLSGAPDAHLQTAATLLGAVGEVKLTRNLRGARWSKLAINSVVSTLGTIGGDRLGALLRHGFVRRLGLEIMTEAAAVAAAEGVVLEKVSGTLDPGWLALSEAERRGPSARLAAKHALLLAVGAKYRRLRSSMLAAIERGRPPAVDFLNGELITRAQQHGLPTPINEAARALVWQIARGEARSSHASLRALYDSTR